MKHRSLGNHTVSAIGLGGMPMSVQGRKDHDTSIATIHAALDAGVTFIDTADAYTLDADGQGHNELLIAEALKSYGGDTGHVLVATKGGLIHVDDGPWQRNGSPEYLAKAARESAARLGVDSIGLYQFHRPDPEVPYEESLGALRQLIDDGVARMVGISNADVHQIRQAHELLGSSLVSAQNQFSPSHRASGPELELCIELGLNFLPWSPLGGIRGSDTLGGAGQAFTEVANEHGVSPQQVALAWELSLTHLIIPIPGASRPESITDSAKAADLVLSSETIAYLSASPATEAA
ncbi:aldo/keto reductase [Microbacterium sp. STN6]|uniref:aldo/keto reductase n=1 Tax=Microbacterium sp. STN6 TaxID=2995588 RepID=UPI002260C635|nr:aldo/keto reductase [Microbacterium sp. STN6]MCX7521781.1 aldo/keto reductase [Microbacterium sp. STN6]